MAWFSSPTASLSRTISRTRNSATALAKRSATFALLRVDTVDCISQRSPSMAELPCCVLSSSLEAFSGELFCEILCPRAVLEVGLDDLQRAEGGGGGGARSGRSRCGCGVRRGARWGDPWGWLAVVGFRVGRRGLVMWRKVPVPCFEVCLANGDVCRPTPCMKQSGRSHLNQAFRTVLPLQILNQHNPLSPFLKTRVQFPVA